MRLLGAVVAPLRVDDDAFLVLYMTLNKAVSLTRLMAYVQFWNTHSIQLHLFCALPLLDALEVLVVAGIHARANNQTLGQISSASAKVKCVTYDVAVAVLERLGHHGSDSVVDDGADLDVEVLQRFMCPSIQFNEYDGRVNIRAWQIRFPTEQRHLPPRIPWLRSPWSTWIARLPGY